MLGIVFVKLLQKCRKQRQEFGPMSEVGDVGFHIVFQRNDRHDKRQIVEDRIRIALKIKLKRFPELTSTARVL